MTTSEVIILSTAGVSITLETKSPLMPEGTLVGVKLDGKGTVTIVDENGKEFPFEFSPSDWFRDSVESSKKKEKIKI